MLSTVWCFGTGIIVTLLLRVTDSCVSSISCPCGSSNINYTHCAYDEMPDVHTCERWAGCQTCKANKMYCETCPAGRSGSKCTEGLGEIKGIFRYRRMNDDYCALSYWRYGRVACHSHLNGTYCDITCNDGTEGRNFCSPGKTWNPSLPYCAFPTYCLDPGIPIGGKRMNAEGSDDSQVHTFYSGESIVFCCQNKDFILEGSHAITCINGTWSDPMPQCQKFQSEYKEIYADLGISDDGYGINLHVCKNAASQFFSQPFIVYVLTFFVLSLVIFFYNLSLIYS